MNKLQKYFRDYLAKSSRLKIAGDVFFYLFILSVLLPWSRTFLIRSILINPGFLEAKESVVLEPTDYDLLLSDLNGKTINLSEYRGKTLFISFWATWCPPCRAELPSIENLYNSYGDRINFFLITTEPEDKVKAFLNENHYDLPVYFQKSASSEKLSVRSYPTSYVVSDKAEIRVRKKGAARWNSRAVKRKLDGLLKGSQ